MASPLNACAIRASAFASHLKDVARLALERSESIGIRAKAVGIATAGWVNADTGQIVYATENLPGWTGTQVATELEDALALPVAVENDANALAIAERYFGAGRGVDDFVCITLGTDVGGGCYSGGRLVRGAHFLGNAIGHIVLDRSGELCSCGQRGCLETFANAAALMRYAKGEFASAEELIVAAHAGEHAARAALAEYAGHLATGVASIVHLLDPSMIVLAGGISANNQFLLADLNALLPSLLICPGQRNLRVVPSTLGYYGAVYSAGALAKEKYTKHDSSS